MFRYPPPRFLLLRSFRLKELTLALISESSKMHFLNRKSFNLFLQSLKSEEKQ